MICSKHSRSTVGKTLTVSEGDAIEAQVDQSATSSAAEANIKLPKQEVRKVHRNKMIAREDAASALLVNVLEACNLLGGIHPRTLARLEKRGLIRSIGGLVDRKLYATADLKSLVEDLRSWSPAGVEVSK